MTTYRFLQPLDVLFPRGNRLFGDPGSHGESLVPPWPSAVAGALRSRILADDGTDLRAFAAGKVAHPILGTPSRPGAFAVTDFHPARLVAGERVEGRFPVPADLIVAEAGDGSRQVERLRPWRPTAGIRASVSLPALPVLPASERGKPAAGYWLTQDGWQDYLTGATPKPAHCERTDRLWAFEARVGVGLDPDRRRADDGKLFTAQAVALTPEAGFLVGVQGAEPPAAGLLRFGGDGRALAIRALPYVPPRPDHAAIAAARRCRIVLTSPGLFPEGWRLPGTAADRRWRLGGAAGTLVCAAVPRAETVSGWDLARWQPKPARRAAPTGSVYWIEDLEASPSDLEELFAAGLWSAADAASTRRAEGFNRFTFAAY